jgi:hypothetical protein
MFQATWETQFLGAPNSAVLKIAPPTYTNETNTAQSIPLIDSSAYIREGIRPGRPPNIIPGGGSFYNDVTGAPTPQNPAAPDPPPSPGTPPTPASTKPLVWAGLAAGLIFLVWIAKGHL